MAQTCQGDLPTAGMAQLYVEVAPERHVPVKLVYAAVLGANGRLILSGRNDAIAEARAAALAALA